MASKAKTSRSTKAKTTEEKHQDKPTSKAEILPPPDEIRNLGKRELVDRVVEASGIKKRAAKPVVEAMLRELGDALSRGDTLNLHPFGKGIVKTRKSLENAEVIELRLRRSKQALAQSSNSSDDEEPIGEVIAPLAEAAE